MIVYFGNVPLYLEIASSPSQKMKGLSGRRGLLPGWGMLFPFSQDVVIPFTMKEMLFPIDIIFLDVNGRIIGSYDSALPGDSRAYYAPSPYRYVIEASEGFYRQHPVNVVTFSR
jgi:uncharacterized protein